jgi:hypothetical protein
VLLDWPLAGELTVAARFDQARTICRPTERCVVRLVESGETIQLRYRPMIASDPERVLLANPDLVFHAVTPASILTINSETL